MSPKTPGKEVQEMNVANDHIESIIKNATPLSALEELIWNALDADANNVEITLEKGGLRDLALAKINVMDDGHGINIGSWRDAFGLLGGSLKLRTKLTPAGRFYHGKTGKGRLKALSIGNKVTWRTCINENDEFVSYDLVVFASSIKKTVREHERRSLKGHTGTVVSIEGIDSNHPQLLNDMGVIEQLERHFSLYLSKYPGIRVTYNGRKVDPDSKVAHRKSTHISCDIKDHPHDFELTIVEWKSDAKTERKLHLCDENGIVVEELVPNVRSFGIPFTAYLKSSLFKEMDEKRVLFSMDESLTPLIKDVRKRIRKHFKERQEAIQNEIIASWQRDNVYPYQPVEKDPIVRVQQHVFNHCALTINKKLPGFRSSSSREKEIVFRLLKVALSDKPESVIQVLNQVFDLKPAQFEEFADLIQKTKLTAVIKSASLVLDRITFIESLEPLLYSDFREALLETQHLQKILCENLWLFGEQYHLGLSDRRLTTLLKAHLKILERDEIAPIIQDQQVDDALPNRRIDLMLYQRVSHPKKTEHLVVELKRPKVSLGTKEISQIKSYAFQVAKNARFNKERVQWRFILLGNELDEEAEFECRDKDREFGHIIAKDNIDIYVKTWSDIIEDAKWRYDLFYKNLVSEVTDEETRRFLHEKHSECLPKKKTAKKSSKKVKKKIRSTTPKK